MLTQLYQAAQDTDMIDNEKKSANDMVDDSEWD